LRKPRDIPERELLMDFLRKGKTVDWISERWSVPPQTVKAWFEKLNIHLSERKGVKTQYKRNVPDGPKECPVCQSNRSVNYIHDIKHMFCILCEVEFDKYQTIYVYDDSGKLVEVIGQKPNFWLTIRFGKDNDKGLIKTVTL